MKITKTLSHNFKKASLICVFIIGLGVSSFGGTFYSNQTTFEGEKVVFKNKSISNYLLGKYWWISNFSVVGSTRNFSGSYNIIYNNGDIVFNNPGPPDTYTVSFILWVEGYENDPFPSYYFENFILTVKESCESVAAYPTGNNIKDGDVIISTQTQMDNFYNKAAGANQGKKYTKVNGDLFIYGNSSSDPITSLCNLNVLNEVTGHLQIKQFNNTANPTDLRNLESLTKTGRLTILANSKLLDASLPALQTVDQSLFIRTNSNLRIISLPKLISIGNLNPSDYWLHIVRNDRVQKIEISNLVTPSVYRMNLWNVILDQNGQKASSPLIIDLNRLKTVNNSFTFTRNNNSGVSNFDNIFSQLDTVKGNLNISNNSYLAKCCVAASTVVLGNRTISGNTGNCSNLSSVTADCGALMKRQKLDNFETVEVLQDIVLYPVPSHGNFEIRYTSAQQGVIYLKINDLTGREIYSKTHSLNEDGSISIELEDITSGQYILSLSFNDKTIFKRISIVK